MKTRFEARVAEMTPGERAEAARRTARYIEHLVENGRFAGLEEADLGAEECETLLGFLAECVAESDRPLLTVRVLLTIPPLESITGFLIALADHLRVLGVVASPVHFFAGGEAPIENASTITLPTGQVLLVWLEEGTLCLRRGLEDGEPLDLRIELGDGGQLGPYPSMTEEPSLPPIHRIPADELALLVTHGGTLTLVPRDTPPATPI